MRGWPARWWHALTEVGATPPERRQAVLREIDEGSRPTLVYYVLLGISELIAGFALIIDSDATLIGANVVAPLMTPIFGISLGLLRGDSRLLRKALLAEFGGAALGVVLCAGLGLLPLGGEASPALLAQTRPTLIDLLVAALAGFAGVLAMIDRRISPVLPGVAIATALNPPIAAIGLCLAAGSLAGAWGAFLLFSANVLAILGVGAVLFLWSGFVTRSEVGPLAGLVRRFAGASLGLLLVSTLLTLHLLRLVRDIRTDGTVRAVLEDALSHVPNTALEGFESSRADDGLDVLSTVRTPRVIEPGEVERIQERLAAALHAPVRLFVRSLVTADVSATGTTSLRPFRGLDGRVTEAALGREARLRQEAEQVAREAIAEHPQLVLHDVELVPLATGPVVVVSVEGPREPAASDVAALEERLRVRLGDPTLRAVLRRSPSADFSAKGHVLFGDAHFGGADAGLPARRAVVETAVRVGIDALPDLFATAVDAVRRETGWEVRAEVVGPRVPTPAEVHAIEQRGTAAAGERVALSVWARVEVQVTGAGYGILGGASAPERAAEQ